MLLNIYDVINTKGLPWKPPLGRQAITSTYNWYEKNVIIISFEVRNCVLGLFDAIKSGMKIHGRHLIITSK